VKQYKELDNKEPNGRIIDSAGIKESFAERRMSVPTACSECVSRQSCALSRSNWFQSIKTVSFYGRHVTLIRQGDPVKRVHVLRRGWLQIAHTIPNGKSIIDLWPPGNILGLSSIMLGDPAPYTATTLEDSEFEQADAAEFLKYLKKDAHVTFDLLRYISRKNRRLMEYFYDAAAKTPLEDRLLRALMEISATCSVQVEGGIRINLPLPMQILADRLGCSRQWISKLLGELEARGVLKRRNGWITLNHTNGNHQLLSGLSR
jgi:CRP/FNR family transcriptional regulator, cyclic AMP receptor protein